MTEQGEGQPLSESELEASLRGILRRMEEVNYNPDDSTKEEFSGLLRELGKLPTSKRGLGFKRYKMPIPDVGFIGFKKFS